MATGRVCKDARIDGALRVSVGLEPLPLELGRKLTVRQVPTVDYAPAALIAPSPGRRGRPTRSGDPLGPWAASLTLRLPSDCHLRCHGTELHAASGGPRPS